MTMRLPWLFRQKTELERFVEFLEDEGRATSWTADAYDVAQLEDQREHARTIVGFYRECGEQVTTVPELVELVSAHHRGFGASARGVEDWVFEFKRREGRRS